MQNVRKIVKVFIASPGDLNPERKIAREVVEEFNSLHADSLGYQIEMVGWEETVGSMGRPQEIINKDLARCELFIGMLWKRWGTPPDLDGKFTSGFEEEFTLSIERYKNEGKPQVSMFFKEIEQEFLRDPGDDLKKVLEFKNNLIQGKKILFEGFSNDKDFERKLRKRLTTYVNELNENDSESKIEEKKNQSSIEIVDNKAEDKKIDEISFFSEFSFNFINIFISKIKKDGWEKTTPTDIAYFKLLANTLKKSNNDDDCLGPHDSNLIYLNSKEYQLGPSESHGLVMAGFENFDSHNVPLWKWISDNKLKLEFYSLIAKEQRKRKVIDALRLISHPIKDNRDLLLDDWFSEDSIDSVKISALKYLSELGTESDVDIILKEYEKKDISTNNAAIDAIISIRMRDSVSKGFESIMEFQPTLISNKILRSIKENGNFIHDDKLKLGLYNKNKSVREICLELIIARKKLDKSLSTELMSHEDYDIRTNCLIFLSDENYNLYKDKAKLILTFKDKDGKDNKDKYVSFLKTTLHLEDKERLIAKKNEPYSLDADALIALAKKEKKRYIAEVRDIVKDNCDIYYQNILMDFQSHYEKMLPTLKEIESSIRNKITSDCADWLFECMEKTDIFILRDLLSRKNTAITSNIIRYISKFGEWQDIPLLYNANYTLSNNTLLGFGSKNNKMINMAVSAIIKIGKDRESELLLLPMGSDFKSRVIAKLSRTEFTKITKTEIKVLLNDEDTSLREKLALKIVECLPRNNIEVIMKDYLSQDTYFYNVVHWLDLGLALKRGIAQKTAKSALQQFLDD